MKEQPSYRRWVFHIIRKKLESGLAPVVVVRGPRQVGKTTLQMQLIEQLGAEGYPASRIFRIQFDDLPSLRGVADPILTVTRWFEQRILESTLNAAARTGPPVLLCLDEVQNLPDWAPQVKALVDHHDVKVLITGSSALRIEAGRDSLAGRIIQVELGTLLLREVAGLRFQEEIAPFFPENGLEPLLSQGFWQDLARYGESHASIRDQAFTAFSERGGYPIAHARPDSSWAELADHLNETVIKRAIQHDLRIGERGQKRDAQLLEEVFRLACRYAGQAPGQAVFVPEIRQALDADVGWQRILAYLRFLDGAMLLRLVPPLEIRMKKRKGNHKLCLCDHGLRASWLEEFIPLDEVGLEAAPHLRDLAGHLAESVVGYFLGGIPHLDVAHYPERGAEPEVDFVLTIGDRRIPVEVKYRSRTDAHRDTVGLRAFLEKTVYNAPFGILVTMNENEKVSDPRIVQLSLRSLLMLK